MSGTCLSWNCRREYIPREVCRHFLRANPAVNLILMTSVQPFSFLSGNYYAGQVVADLRDGGLSAAVEMDYGAFSNDSIAMMYEAVRGALAADDALERQGRETRFNVRDTPEWKKHAADLESEMLRRGMMFTVIDWHEGQARLPFGP